MTVEQSGVAGCLLHLVRAPLRPGTRTVVPAEGNQLFGFYSHVPALYACRSFSSRVTHINQKMTNEPNVSSGRPTLYVQPPPQTTAFLAISFPRQDPVSSQSSFPAWRVHKSDALPIPLSYTSRTSLPALTMPGRRRSRQRHD